MANTLIKDYATFSYFVSKGVIHILQKLPGQKPHRPKITRPGQKLPAGRVTIVGLGSTKAST